MREYSKWKEGDIEQSPHWQRLQDNLLLSLIKKILTHSPSKRYNLLQIKNHLWVKKKFKDSNGTLIEPEIAANSPKRKLIRVSGNQDDSNIGMKNNAEAPSGLTADLSDRLCASQPVNR